MFRHLLKLTWKRKTRNLMLSLEILLAFALVFAIAAFGVRYYQLYRMPIGFNGDDVWAVGVRTSNGGRDNIDQATYDAFKRGLQELPEVGQVAFASWEPYSMMMNRSSPKNQSGVKVQTDMLYADDGLAKALGIKVIEGRWFSALDDGSAAFPVVVNRRMANAMFPGKSAIGQQFTDSDRDGIITYKVVGVVDEYRDQGELGTPGNFTFIRHEPPQRDARTITPQRDARTIILKLQPGTERSFEFRLSQRLRQIQGSWSYQISPLSATRQTKMKTQTTPLIVLGVIAAFMLVMVAFGLFGALWQNTTQRIPEFGLRRAAGANAGDIYRQIVGEQMLLSTVAIVVGMLLLVQLPLTGALGASLNWTVFLGATGLSMFVIYLISLLCALYPGWRASRLSPTEALHYE
ncbi:ABC transporter permease [Massilia horti]|uniref:FtsX-like permease family protein n=1 Tax=Massilia horti TaxID=2562153 RepID=A0A4Y9SYL7_9BURK|nr:ABC transporter permease [Massilia horti]TFW31535.1 FtsX-like permease family protein [Massilia horti]